MKFTCHDCGRSFNVPDDSPGPIRCFCGYSISLPVVREARPPRIVSCPHNQHGICQLATRLANRVVLLENYPDACTLCELEPVPFTLNKVTASLAIVNRDKSKPIDPYLVQVTHGTAHLAGHILERYLYKWMRRFRITPPTTCGCGEWISKMNAWGIDECLLRSDEIATHLKESLNTLELPSVVTAFLTTKVLKKMVVACLSKPRLL